MLIVKMNLEKDLASSESIPSLIPPPEVITHPMRSDSKEEVPMEESPRESQSKNYRTGSCPTVAKRAKYSEPKSVSSAKLKKFVCTYPNCGFRTHLNTSMVRHVLTHDPNRAKVSCPLCGTQFFRKDDMDRHRRLHGGEHPPFKCHRCPKVWETGTELRAHVAAGHKGPSGKVVVVRNRPEFPCPNCSREFDKRSRLDLHQKKVHGTSLENGNHHEESESSQGGGTETDNNNDDVEPSTASQPSTDFSVDLKQVPEPDSPVHADPDESKVTKSTTDPVTTRELLRQCCDLEIPLVRLDMDKIHNMMMMRRARGKAQDPVNQCSEPDEVSEGASSPAAPVVKISPVSDQDAQQLSLLDLEPESIIGTSCPYCSYEGLTSWHVRRHVVSHAKDKPFSCPFVGCSYRSKWESNIQVHRKRHHKGKKPAKGPATTRTPRDCHALVIPKSKPAQRGRPRFIGRSPTPAASATAAVFKNKPAAKFQNGESQKNLTIIGKTGKKPILVQKINDPETGMTYMGCTQCAYRGATHSHIRSHMLVHQVEKPFACSYPQCNYRSKRRGDLNEHEKCVHGRGTMSVWPPPAAAAVGEIRKRGRPPLIFKTHNNDDRLANHTEPWPDNVCRFCVYVSRLGQYLRKHLKQCPACKKSTAAAAQGVLETPEGALTSNLEQNIRLPRSGEPADYQCLLCDYVGDSQTSALKHAKCHKTPVILLHPI